MANSKNFKLNDVVETIKSASKAKHKKCEIYSHKRLPDSPDKYHLQGIIEYRDYTILSHSGYKHGDSKRGFCIVGDKRGSHKESQHNISTWKYYQDLGALNEYNQNIFSTHEHPGSMQKIGDYAVCAFESHKNKTNGKRNRTIAIFGLATMNLQNLIPEFCKEVILPNQFTDGAGATGIADFLDADGVNRYALVAQANHSADFYVAKGDDLLAAVANGFEHKFSHDFGKDMDYENSVILCDTNNKLYFVGMRSTYNYSDYIDIYQISFEKETLETNKSWNNIDFSCTDTNGAVAFAAPHFRWGATIDVLSSEKVKVIMCERDYSDSVGKEKELSYRTWEN